MDRDTKGRVFAGAIFIMFACLLSLVLAFPAKAGPVATPAVLVRSFVGTATDTAQLVEIQTTTGQKVGPTASLTVCNDDAAGGQDLWVSFNGTASDPGSTFTASNTFVVKATEKLAIDGQFLRFSVMCATAGQTVPTRVICTY